MCHVCIETWWWTMYVGQSCLRVYFSCKPSHPKHTVVQVVSLLFQCLSLVLCWDSWDSKPPSLSKCHQWPVDNMINGKDEKWRRTTVPGSSAVVEPIIHFWKQQLHVLQWPVHQKDQKRVFVGPIWWVTSFLVWHKLIGPKYVGFVCIPKMVHNISSRSHCRCS